MDAPGSAATDFLLTKAEQDLSGISYDDGTLFVRSSLLIRCVMVGMIAFGVIFIVAGCVAVASIGVFAIVAPVAGIAFVVHAVRLVRGAVVATAGSLGIRTLRERRFPWSEVDDFRITDRPRWLIGWRTEIVQVVLHSGKRIRLWTTLSNKGEWQLYGGPGAAHLKRDVLLRYREMCAKQ